jgi:ketosteroid isomerase-like protein
MNRAYAAANRRDFDLIRAVHDPEHEYLPSSDLMPPDLEPVFHGHEGYLRLWRYWLDAFEDIRWDPEEMLDVGTKVLVTTHQVGHGSGSGVAVSEPVFQLFTFRRGLVVRQEDFLDRSQALEALRHGGPERDALDGLLVRFPVLAGSMAERIRRMSPGSALRSRLVNLQVKRAFAAMARSDVEVLLLSYEPDVEVWMKSMSGVGISDCYRGHAGIRALYADLDDAFSDWRWTIRGVADGGDRIAVRADFVGFGRSSGVRTSIKDGGTAVRLSARGRAVWQEWFVEQDGWKRALEAVGLRE